MSTSSVPGPSAPRDPLPDDAASSVPATPPSVGSSAATGPGSPTDAPWRFSDGSTEVAPTIGHIGRYALKYALGEGGIGTVYAAHDPLLSRPIAVKTLHVDVDEEQRGTFNALFLDEARAAAGLSHPQIVTVFDAGISDNRAYIAMELLRGRDLRQLRGEGWRPTPAQAALIARRVADALAYAHSKGVVHRDIKPANIFMTGRTQPRVLDFGIARIAHGRDVAAGAELAAGSPHYMAPEQALQQPTDRRTDVFSLGVVLYELLTDLKPFRGESLAEITRAVLEHDPPPADAVNPAVPTGLATIVAKAMAKDPEGRYRSAGALSRELRRWLDEHEHAQAQMREHERKHAHEQGRKHEHERKHEHVQKHDHEQKAAVAMAAAATPTTQPMRTGRVPSAGTRGAWIRTAAAVVLALLAGLGWYLAR